MSWATTVNAVHDTFGNVIPDLSNGGTTDLGEIDRNWTQSRSLGASGQAVDTAQFYGHDNTLTVGASLDYGWTRFTGNSQLGIVPALVNNSLPVIGLPFIIDEPDSFLNPILAHTNNTYAGIYALDTFSVTDRLTVTAGGALQLRRGSTSMARTALFSTASRTSSTSIRLSASPTSSRLTSTSMRDMR